MRVLISKEMRVWFLVNILLPIAIPVCFVWSLKIAVRLEEGFWGIIEMLWRGGVSVLFGLFALISLYPLGTSKFDGKFATRYVTAYFTLVIPIFLVTCFLYLSYLSIVPGGVDFAENLVILTVVTVICVLAAISFKVIILNKIKKEEECRRMQNTFKSQDVPIID